MSKVTELGSHGSAGRSLAGRGADRHGDASHSKADSPASIARLPVSCTIGEASSEDGRHYKLAVGRERLMVQSRQTGRQTAIRRAGPGRQSRRAGSRRRLFRRARCSSMTARC